MTALQCDACGNEVGVEASFCQRCGGRLGAARKLSPDAIRAERKVVTVLFADLKGSLELIAGQDPERVDEILATVIDAMRRAVHRFGGTVSQTLGDGIMALFGAPRAVEDHAIKACLAALAMRAAVRLQTEPRLWIRVGLHSGEVVVRAMQDDVTARYGAIGETVHLAARMEQTAAPDQILLTPETHRLVRDVLDVRTLGPRVLKGMDGAVEVFELLRAAPQRTRSHRRASDRSTPFVGREADMAVMHQARDQVAAGQGRVVRVLGDAGSGKSRLLREFLDGLPASEWLICRGDALPHRQLSYGTFIAAMTGLFGFEPDDSLDTRRGKLNASLPELVGGEPGALTQPLSSLLDLGVEEPVWHVLDPWERRERTGQAICELFLRASRGPRSAALVIEDAHWLDSESASLFERLAALSAGERLLKIVTERVEQKLNWGDTASWTMCHLASLDEAASRRLLRLHLVPGPGVAGLEEQLIEHTRGNPLFIEECLYALAEAGELARAEGGRFQLVGTVGALRVPRSLRGLLDARVDRLLDADKDVLQAAAVVGTTVPMDLLGSVAGLAEETLRPALDRLCRDGFLLADPIDGSRFAFRHGLTREAVYNSILLRTRSHMHARAIEALESRPGATTDAVDLLADHAFRAEAWPKAVAYARQSGAKAAKRDANGEALRAYEQALAAAARWPSGPAREEALLDLHLDARNPLFRLGDVAGLLEHLDAATASAVQHGDPGRVGQCQAFRSHALWLAGESEGALAAASSMEEVASATADQDLRIRARYQKGLVYFTQSRTALTVAAMRDVAVYIGSQGAARKYGLDPALAVTACGYLARAAADAGDFATAEQAVADVRARAQRLDQRFSWIFADTAEGYVHLMQGRADQAIAPFERAVATCHAASARLLGPVPAGLLAWARVETGRADQGVALAQQAVADAARMGFMPSQPMRLAILARAHCATGALREAQARAEEARALAHRLGELGSEAFALCQSAEVHLRRGDRGPARDALAAALARAQALGLAPLAAECARVLEDL